jgi:uncharacterized protein
MLARVFAGGLFAVMLLPAQAPPVSSIPNPVPNGEWVADTAGLFSDADRERVRALLRSIHRSTGVQFAVATVPAGGTREYAIQVFQHWALGTAKDNNGLLLLLSKEERAIEIVTGKGLDAVLSDTELQKALSSMRSGGNALEGVKTIGASIKGFDRTQPVPMQALLIAAGISGLLGLGGAAWFLRHAVSPVLLPEEGIRQETKHYPNGQLHKSEFATRNGTSFLRQQASALAPGYDKYAQTPLYVAAAGLTVFAAATAAWIVAGLRFNLEPSFSITAGIASALSGLGVVALYKPHAGRISAWLQPFAVSSLASAALFWLIFRDRFFSDFGFAVYAVGGFVLAASALINGLVVYVLQDNGRRKLRYACAKCRGEVNEIPQHEIENYLRGWEARSRQEYITYFRGWRCPSCRPEPAGRGAYVVYAVGYENLVCEKCSRPAISITNEKGGWAVRRCFACGHENRKQSPKGKKNRKGSGTAGVVAATGAIAASAYESGSYDNDDDYSSYDHNSSSSSWDDSPASGGSTDGGGASGNWNND